MFVFCCVCMSIRLRLAFDRCPPLQARVVCGDDPVKVARVELLVKVELVPLLGEGMEDDAAAA